MQNTKNNHDDIIAWLLPYTGVGFHGALRTTRSTKNKPLCIKAAKDAPEEHVTLENTDHLAIKLSARTSGGVIVGCGEDVEVHVERKYGVSNRHLAITFDDQNRPIARDLGSITGTSMSYNGKETKRLSNFAWLLQGPSIAKGKPPVLNFTKTIRFEVILPRRDYTSPEWVEKVKKFRLGTGDPDNMLLSLALHAPITQLLSGQQTVARTDYRDPVFHEKPIGAGSFGNVTYMWNVTSGEEYVVKRPRKNVLKSREFDEEAWKKEAKIMRTISHEHIVAFRNASFSAGPELAFEYVADGSLDKHENLSSFENTQVLCQLSSALDYLHNCSPPIAHRDIKSENILVARRGPDGIFVKFADFGLSKAADVLRTICGTLNWVAPEVYSKFYGQGGTPEDTYGTAVDIWSLGAVVASLECEIPDHKDEWQYNPVARVRAIEDHIERKSLEQGTSEQLLDLIRLSMLCEDPKRRASAAQVHDEALRILQNMATNEGSVTPKASIPNVKSKSIDAHDDGKLLKTVEAVPQKSAVANSKRSASVELGGIEIRNTDKHKEADDATLVHRSRRLESPAVASGSKRKRAFVINEEEPDPKRSRPSEENDASLVHRSRLGSPAAASGTKRKRAFVVDEEPDPERSRTSKEDDTSLVHRSRLESPAAASGTKRKSAFVIDEPDSKRSRTSKEP